MTGAPSVFRLARLTWLRGTQMMSAMGFFSASKTSGAWIAAGRAWAALTVLSFCAGAGSSGCAADVEVARPAVRFTQPRGAVLYLVSGDGAVRVRFGGTKRASPVVCEATRALLDVRRRGAGRRYVLLQFASRPGFARAQLHDVTGRILARGRFCIFPTLKSHRRKILQGYTVGIPPAAMRLLRAGRPVALYQSYRPQDPPPEAYWQHVAWVLYLDPRR